MKPEEIKPRVYKFEIKAISVQTDKKNEAYLTLNKENGKLSFEINGIKERVFIKNYNHSKSLRELDKKVTKKGYKILCNGTSLGFNCISSGDRLYRYDGQRMLNIYEYEDWNIYATEEEQKRFWNRISENLKEFYTYIKKHSEYNKLDYIKKKKVVNDWLIKKGLDINNLRNIKF